MNIRETVQTGRRPRRKNGNARSDTLWHVRGVEDSTRDRINYLANELGTTNGAVIDVATKFLFKTLHEQDEENGRKRTTFSQTISLYVSLLSDNDEPSDDPAVIELEKRLLERRKVRDAWMDRKTVDAFPEAPERDREVLSCC